MNNKNHKIKLSFGTVPTIVVIVFLSWQWIHTILYTHNNPTLSFTEILLWSISMFPFETLYSIIYFILLLVFNNYKKESR